MTFAPIAPTTAVAPTKIAHDTYVIHQVQPALGQPLFVYINSMVILGKEPVIVGWTTTSGAGRVDAAPRRVDQRASLRAPATPRDACGAEQLSPVSALWEPRDGFGRPRDTKDSDCG